MLPVGRSTASEFSLSLFDVVPSDVEGFMDTLAAFQAVFHDCCTRREPRAHFFDEMAGPFSKMERKSIAPRALRVAGASIRGLQRFISASVWDEESMLWHDQQLVAEAMGEPKSVLMVDASGCVNKGADSAGVARQYCGALGKVEHCHVGVFAGDASQHGYALVDKRLFLPEAW